MKTFQIFRHEALTLQTPIIRIHIYFLYIYNNLQNLTLQQLSKFHSDNRIRELFKLKPNQNSMAIRWMSLVSNAKQFHKLQSLLYKNQLDVPNGHLAIYVGDITKKRYVVPISYLNHPSFQGLLHRAEEEFGFNHPTGGLTIPCSENAFLELTSRIQLS